MAKKSKPPADTLMDRIRRVDAIRRCGDHDAALAGLMSIFHPDWTVRRGLSYGDPPHLIPPARPKKMKRRRR